MNDNDKNQGQATSAASVSENEDNIEIIDENEGSDLEQEIQDPEQQVAQLTDDLAKEREKYLRALADMDNLRKRSRREIEDARIKGQMAVLEEMLPALDSIDMATKSVEPNDANQAVYDGMLMVQKQFLTSMERFGLKRVVAVGQKFDPSLHEAVSYVPSPDHDAGSIINDMRAGYLLGEKLLRASMVVVSAGQPAPVSAGADPGTADTNGTDA